jgi:integrase/recombinase XerD
MVSTCELSACMYVQRVVRPDGNRLWLVLDEHFRPVRPIYDYLRHLETLQRSPHTLEHYARHLKLYWDFLRCRSFDWQTIRFEQLAEFITWLRQPEPNIPALQPQEAKRTDSSINTILSVVYSFYDFHTRTGAVKNLQLTASKAHPRRGYKPFLHHITKGKAVERRLLTLKTPKKHPKTLTSDQVMALVDACYTLRDRFLICLLYETGMRIGQALGLRHEDIRSWDNEIDIVPRKDNVNGARAKTRYPFTIHVRQSLMALYSQYLTDEYPFDVDCDYVFVTLKGPVPGTPLKRDNIADLFRRLGTATHIDFHPHMLRHTHATELLKAGWDEAYVQKRLGHASVQTTIDTYAHLDDDDLKAAYKGYLEAREADQ